MDTVEGVGKENQGVAADAAAPELLSEGVDALDTLEKLRADLAEDDANLHAQRIAVLDTNIAYLSAAIAKALGQ